METMKNGRKLPMRRGNYLFFLSEFLSNWEHSPMGIDGDEYNCVEQYMMAEKARLFGDNIALSQIMAANHPSDQKRYGRMVRGYIDSKWADVRYDVVLKATLEKYRQNEHLRELLFTCDRDCEFVEANPEDCIWAIGMKKSDAGIEDPANWKGINLLGKAITEARAILLEEFNV